MKKILKREYAKEGDRIYRGVDDGKREYTICRDIYDTEMKEREKTEENREKR